MQLKQTLPGTSCSFKNSRDTWWLLPKVVHLNWRGDDERDRQKNYYLFQFLLFFFNLRESGKPSRNLFCLCSCPCYRFFILNNSKNPQTVTASKTWLVYNLFINKKYLFSLWPNPNCLCTLLITILVYSCGKFHKRILIKKIFEHWVGLFACYFRSLTQQCGLMMFSSLLLEKGGPTGSSMQSPDNCSSSHSAP